MSRSLFASFLIVFTLSSTVFVPLAQAEFTCGKWEDVDSSSMYALNHVCGVGLMAGMDESVFAQDAGISRAQAATIGNRIFMSPSRYESSSQTGAFYVDFLDDFFSDLPELHVTNNWILKAMYYAKSNAIMSGDGAEEGALTTFRPLAAVTAAEFLKIVFESAERGELLEEYASYPINYEQTPWYSDLVKNYERLSVFSDYSLGAHPYAEYHFHYDEEDPFKYQVVRLDLNEVISREDAAYFLHELLSRNVMQNPEL